MCNIDIAWIFCLFLCNVKQNKTKRKVEEEEKFDYTISASSYQTVQKFTMTVPDLCKIFTISKYPPKTKKAKILGQ